MNSIFSYVVKYEIKAVCETPLRSGVENTETVLKRHDGCAMIQGTSISGSLRNFLENEKGKNIAEKIFGTQEKQSRVIISDGIFDIKTVFETRPRLRIDGKSGSVKKGAKFEIAHISVGSEFNFNLTWLGEKETLDEISIIEGLLSAINSGYICFGAQKTNGFGRVKLTVKRCDYDMYIKEQRENWIYDKFEGKILSLPQFKPYKNKISFDVEGYADKILIKSSDLHTIGKKTVVGNIKESNGYVLPASSIKGAIREQVYKIATLLGIPEYVDELFGRDSSNHNDNGKAGKVYFEDIKLEENTSVISRIRINKFTGGVIRNGLFSEEPISSKINFTVTLDAENNVGCGLILYALRDLGLGLYSLGSGSSIGRGFITVSNIKAITTQGENVKISFNNANVEYVEDNFGLIDKWFQSIYKCKEGGL